MALGPLNFYLSLIVDFPYYFGTIYVKQPPGSFLSLLTLAMSLEVMEVFSTLLIQDNLTAFGPERTTFNSNLSSPSLLGFGKQNT